MDDKNTNRTIEYYNTHADRYSEVTRNADMSDIYKRFEEHLKPGSRILDLGCGSGRDSKYFLDKGYKVVSLDASEAMCRKTQELTGKAAVHMRIEDMNYENEFDAVWACASLLHVARAI
ncbi:MAG: class I SAM-dependent methyltransferase [Coprococcus sp.]